MISVGLLIFIVVAAAIMPYIAAHLSSARTGFLTIYRYCILFGTLLIYLMSFLQGLWESYKGNPVFPTWGMSPLTDYFPDIGAILFGLIVGNFVAFVIWLSMKANN